MAHLRCWLCMLGLMTAGMASGQPLRWERDDLVLNPSGLDLAAANGWAWGDVDGDGITDVLVRKDGGTIYGRLFAYRGTGQTSPPYWVPAPSLLDGLRESATPAGVALADLDGDGLPEILTGQIEETTASLIHWRRGDGGWRADTSLFAGIPVADDFYGRLSMPAFADVDADGDLDFVIGSQSYPDYRFHFFENTGTSSKPMWREDSTRLAEVNREPIGYNAWSPLLIECTGDSLPDLLVAFDLEGAENIAIFPAQEDSAGMHWVRAFTFERVFAISFRSGISKMLAQDMNGDGVADLLILEPWGTARVYLGDKSRAAGFAAGYFRIGAPAVPLLAAPIVYFNSKTNGLSLIVSGLLPGFAGNETIFQAHQQARLAGKMLWLDAEQFMAPPMKIYESEKFKGELGDLDRNGFVDLVWSAAHAGYRQATLGVAECRSDTLGLRWQNRDALVTSFREAMPDSAGSYFDDPSLADLDADGDLDLLLFRKTFDYPPRGEIALYENVLAADTILWRLRPEWRQGLPDGVFYSGNFGDVDGDGDADLVFGKTGSGVLFYENIGDRSVPGWRLKSSNAVQTGNAVMPSLADLDSDGLADLFVGDGAGKVWFYRNTTLVGATARQKIPPSGYQLLQNYPNPFRGETTFSFTLSRPAPVKLTIYNLLGQQVAVLLDGSRPAGEHRLRWQISASVPRRRMPSGVLFAELQVGEQKSLRKLLILP